MDKLIYLVPVLGLLGLLVMILKSKWVMKQESGETKMKEIAEHIREGALAFLSAEYRILAIFVVIAGALLGVISGMVETTHWFIIIAFVIGAFFSALAGNIGMRIATAANVRTTQAARTSLPQALKVSFSGRNRDGIGSSWTCSFSAYQSSSYCCSNISWEVPGLAMTT